MLCTSHHSLREYDVLGISVRPKLFNLFEALEKPMVPKLATSLTDYARHPPR